MAPPRNRRSKAARQNAAPKRAAHRTDTPETCNNFTWSMGDCTQLLHKLAAAGSSDIMNLLAAHSEDLQQSFHLVQHHRALCSTGTIPQEFASFLHNSWQPLCLALSAALSCLPQHQTDLDPPRRAAVLASTWWLMLTATLSFRFQIHVADYSAGAAENSNPATLPPGPGQLLQVMKDTLVVERLAVASSSLAVQLQQQLWRQDQVSTLLALIKISVAAHDIWIILAVCNAAVSDGNLLLEDADLAATVVPIAKLALTLLRIAVPAGMGVSSSSSTGSNHSTSSSNSRLTQFTGIGARSRSSELRSVITIASQLASEVYAAYPISSDVAALLCQQQIAELMMVDVAFEVRQLHADSSATAQLPNAHLYRQQQQEQQQFGRPAPLQLLLALGLPEADIAAVGSIDVSAVLGRVPEEVYPLIIALSSDDVALSEAVTEPLVNTLIDYILLRSDFKSTLSGIRALQIVLRSWLTAVQLQATAIAAECTATQPLRSQLLAAVLLRLAPSVIKVVQQLQQHEDVKQELQRQGVATTGGGAAAILHAATTGAMGLCPVLCMLLDQISGMPMLEQRRRQQEYETLVRGTPSAASTVSSNLDAWALSLLQLCPPNLAAVVQQEPVAACKGLDAALRPLLAAGEEVRASALLLVKSVRGAIFWIAAGSTPAVAPHSRHQQQRQLSLDAQVLSLFITCCKLSCIMLPVAETDDNSVCKEACLSAWSTAAGQRFAAHAAKAATACASSSSGGGVNSEQHRDRAALWLLMAARALVTSGHFLQLAATTAGAHDAHASKCWCAACCQQRTAPWTKYVVQVLLQHLPSLQPPPNPAPTAATADTASTSSNSSGSIRLQAVQQQAAALLEVFSGHSSNNSIEAAAGLAKQLQSFGEAVCFVLPSKFCCNNPHCSNLSKLSELDLVNGKSCVCSRCKQARFCGQSCLEAAWKGHRPVCKALRQQQQQL